MSEANNLSNWITKLKQKLSQKNNLISSPNKKDLKSLSPDLINLFDNLSKKNTNKIGFPDFLYYNKDSNLLIVGESKENIIDHGDADYPLNPHFIKTTAVGGIKHYLEKLKEDQTVQNLNFKVVGLALSGDPEAELNHKVSTFIIEKNFDKKLNVSTKQPEFLLDESEYKKLFDNFDKSNALTKLKEVATSVNEYMRDIHSTERPILISGIIISLFENINIGIEPGKIKEKLKTNPNAVDHQFINENFTDDIFKILKSSGISPEIKIKHVNVLIKNIIQKPILQENDILKRIFTETNKIMPILTEHLEFDVMGDFYQEFSRYQSRDGGDLGIILTPLHIAEFMVELIEIFKEGGINENDIVLDPCCGTGTFLTSFMNKQISKFAKNNPHKKSTIKQNNLIGVEITQFMYTLAIANMLVRGDGKSSIHEEDFFKITNDKLIKNGNKPTIGLMNPPYSQSKKTSSSNNKNEMEFIEKLLNSISTNGYAVVITPKSTLFKTNKCYLNPKERIFKTNTLKAVINMPKDLFNPVATVHTSVAVFHVGKAHNKNDNVFFYNLDYDGFLLLKNNRIDILNKWNEIKENTLHDIKSKKIIPGKSVIVKGLTFKDEWVPEAWIPVDFKKIFDKNINSSFDKVIKEYALFKYKNKTGLLEKELLYKNENNPILKEEYKKTLPSELELFEMIQETGLNAFEIINDKEDSNKND